MKTAEIKSDIVQKISKLSRSKLFQIKGYIENCEHEDVELEDWKALTPQQKERLNESLSQLNSGQSVAHSKVMKELKRSVGGV